MTARERVLQAVFPNRGAIANAAAAVRVDRRHASDRAEAMRAVAAMLSRPPPSLPLRRTGRS
jgi:hypothetical protein